MLGRNKKLPVVCINLIHKIKINNIIAMIFTALLCFAVPFGG